MANSGNGPLVSTGRSAGPAGLALSSAQSGMGASGTSQLPFIAAGPNVVSLWQAFRRRWLLALLLGTLAGALAALAAYLLISPARYTARTLVHIEPRIPTIAYAVDSNRSDPAGYRQTQRTLARSRLVLGNALNQQKVAELKMVKEAIQNNVDPLEELEKQLKTDYSSGSEILAISMNGDNPEELVILVNAIRNAYLQNTVNRERTERLTQMQKLDEQYENYKKTLALKEKELKNLAQTVGSSDLPTVAIKQQFTAESLGTAQKELIKLQGELRSLQIKVQELQAREEKGVEPTVPETFVEEVLRKDAAIARQTEEVKRIEAELEQVRSLATENIVKNYMSRLDAARSKLDTLRVEQRPKVMTQVRDEWKRRSKAALTDYQGQIDFIKKLEESLRVDIKQMEGQLNSLNLGSYDVEVLRRELSRVEVVAKKLGEQKEALQVELGAPSRVQVLEEAVVSRTYNERKQLLGVVLSCLLTFGVVVYGVTYLEFRARRVNSADDVVAGLGMHLVGTLPQAVVGPDLWPVQVGALASGNHGPSALLVESADAMRAMLQNPGQERPDRVLMVTSAQRGEGKTSLACNLAASLARGRNRTVLVDCDLRRPAVHRVFNLSQSPGLQEVLRGEMALADVLRPTALAGLTIVTAGRLAGHPAQVLTAVALQQCLQQLRQQFDYVIVDSCPVLPVADTLLVGQHVDGIIFALLRGASRLPRVYSACQKMAAMGMRILGGVLNGAPGEVCDYDAQYSLKSLEDVHVPPGASRDIHLPRIGGEAGPAPALTPTTSIAEINLPESDKP